jgi:hypothetical protein
MRSCGAHKAYTRRGRKATKKQRLTALAVLLLCVPAAFYACGGLYGDIGGADITDTYRTPEAITERIDLWQGVWYSRYGSRLMDGYTVGKWKEAASVLGSKAALFLNAGFDPSQPRFLDTEGNVRSAIPADETNRGSPGTIHGEDYFIFYDDSLYLQNADTTGTGRGYSWIGIVRAVNIFDKNPRRGAVIVEYLDGAYPDRPPFDTGRRALPFYGVFFRTLTEDSMQIANPLKLAERINGRPYHTETGDLEKAIALNNVENDVEFVDWGETLPQDREGCRQ